MTDPDDAAVRAALDALREADLALLARHGLAPEPLAVEPLDDALDDEDADAHLAEEVLAAAHRTAT